MALGNRSGHAVLVEPTVGGERGYGSVDLIEQGAGLGAIVDLFGRERGSDDLPGVGVYAQVQLPPRPARAGAVSLDWHGTAWMPVTSTGMTAKRTAAARHLR